MLQDHGYNASAACIVLMYTPTFAGTQRYPQGMARLSWPQWLVTYQQRRKAVTEKSKQCIAVSNNFASVLRESHLPYGITQCYTIHPADVRFLPLR